jgi:hypothetical protein
MQELFMTYRYPPTRAQRHPRTIGVILLIILALSISGILWMDHIAGPPVAPSPPTVTPVAQQPTGSRWFWQLSQWMPQPYSAP